MKYAVILLMLMYAKGCDQNKSELQDNIEGDWLITAIAKQKISDSAQTKCSINPETKTLTMTVGCNNHTGNLKMENKILTVSNVFATEMYCPNLADTEKALSDNMPLISNYKYEKNNVLLLNKNGDVIFTLSK